MTAAGTPANAPTSLGRLESDMTRLRDVLSVGDLTAPVSGCPGWTLADLGGHVGGVYRFANVAVTELRSSEVPVGPRERLELLDWFDAGAQTLLRSLAARASEAPCWTMGDPDNVGFWVRRMCHETALHLWDAQSSLGEPASIESHLAVDGVHEIVTMFFPRQVRLGRMLPLTDSLRLEFADEPLASALAIAGDGTHDCAHETDAVLSGPAESLLLLLWKRRGLVRELELIGDVEAGHRVLATALTP